MLKDLGTQRAYLSHGQTVQDLRVTGVLNERLPCPGDRCVLSTTLLAGVSLHRHVSSLSLSLHRHSLLYHTVCTDTQVCPVTQSTQTLSVHSDTVGIVTVGIVPQSAQWHSPQNIRVSFGILLLFEGPNTVCAVTDCTRHSHSLHSDAVCTVTQSAQCSHNLHSDTVCSMHSHNLHSNTIYTVAQSAK